MAAKQPTDAALTPGGDLYFVEAESGVISRLGADGSLNRWSGSIPASTIDGPHLALRPSGGLYVSDPEGRRVLLFDAAVSRSANSARSRPGQAGRACGCARRNGDLVVVMDSQAVELLCIVIL